MKKRILSLIPVFLLILLLNTGCGRKPSRPSIELTPKEAVSFEEKEERELIIKDEKPLLKTKPVVDINSKPELED